MYVLPNTKVQDLSSNRWQHIDCSDRAHSCWDSLVLPSGIVSLILWQVRSGTACNTMLVAIQIPGLSVRKVLFKKNPLVQHVSMNYCFPKNNTHMTLTTDSIQHAEQYNVLHIKLAYAPDQIKQLEFISDRFSWISNSLFVLTQFVIFLVPYNYYIFLWKS